VGLFNIYWGRWIKSIRTYTEVIITGIDLVWVHGQSVIVRVVAEVTVKVWLP
jgi:hypothetical protein